MLRLASLCTVALVAISSGCAMGGAAKYTSAPTAAAPIAPPPLNHSVFSKDPEGALTEDQIQTILDSPIELELPARIGVVPIITDVDWRGPAPDYRRVPAGTHALVKGLRGAEEFTLVTEI